MQAVWVDERDSGWECQDTRFRVYLHVPEVSIPPSFSTDTYDLTECDALQAIDWAQRASGGHPWALALVGESGLEDDEADDEVDTVTRGLTWLVGMDGNDTPVDDVERDVKQRMLARTGDVRIVIPRQDRASAALPEQL